MNPLFMELNFVRPPLGKVLLNLGEVALARAVVKSDGEGAELPRDAKTAITLHSMPYNRAHLVSETYDEILSACSKHDQGMILGAGAPKETKK